MARTKESKNNIQNSIIRFSVSLPESLLHDFDNLVSTQNYASRSEYTRDLLRDKVTESKWNSESNDNEVLGTITMLYDCTAKNMLNTIAEIQRESNMNILTSNHVDINERLRFEMMMLSGKVSELKTIHKKLSGVKNIVLCKLTEASIVN